MGEKDNYPARRMGWLCDRAAMVLAGFLLVMTVIFIRGTLPYPLSIIPDGEGITELSDFAYQLDHSGISGRGVFPHEFKNETPGGEATLTCAIEPGRYEALLIKTAFSALRLYANGILLYETGRRENYPSWLIDPPTELKLVRIPADASELEFFYTFPMQRGSLIVYTPSAGSEAGLMRQLLYRNLFPLIISVVLLLFGGMVIIGSTMFRRSNYYGKPFMPLGQFSLAAGCWGIGECDAMLMLAPFPSLLYVMAYAGLAAMVIPLLSFAMAIFEPKELPVLRFARNVLRLIFIAVLVLQLAGVVALSASLFVVQIADVLGLLIFAMTALSEHIRYHNPSARWFKLPAFVLLGASIFEYLNYYLHFTDILSLFFLGGTLLFTVMLAAVALRSMRKIARDAESAKKAEEKIRFMQRMNHDLRTPMTRISTNLQTARRRPEEADELLRKSQTEIMKMAGMINRALEDTSEEEKPREQNSG